MEFATFKAITELRYSYALSIDTCNWNMHRQLFTDQVDIDFSSYSGGDGATRMSADAWVAGLRPLFTGSTATQHVMTNPQVEMQKNSATMRMYMKAEHFLAEDQVQKEFAIGGYYDDRLALTESGWRFRSVTLTVLWRRGDPGIMKRAITLGERQLAKEG